MARSLAIAALLVAAHTGRARAEACPPAVTLDGDAALVDAVAELLTTRGIALDPPGCPAVAARIEARDGALVVDVDGVERLVGDTATAATVIESFSRDDVGSPLLAIRALPRGPADAADAGATATPAQGGRGIQLFGALETSLASDRTSWLGAHLGACITLGPVCAAARLRFASVAIGAGPFDHGVERDSAELLVGIDIPFAVRHLTFTPGFAAGLGQMHTHDHETDSHAETGGPRADVHATLTIPMSPRLAIDVFAAVDLTQETHADHSSTGMLPPEPRALLRLGAGVRFGGL